MAIIIDKNINSAQPQLPVSSAHIYSETVIEDSLCGTLIRKQNEFLSYLNKIEEEFYEKSGAEVLEIVPETMQSIKKYVQEISKTLENNEQKKLFLRFAETKASRTLLRLKKSSETKTQEYKRKEVMTYCSFLTKSSREFYDDPSVLSENAAYYENYLKLLPEYTGSDLRLIAINAIFTAALEGALENKNSAMAKAYITDKTVAKTMSEIQIAEFHTRIAIIDEENMTEALLANFNPQSELELKNDIDALEKAEKEGIIKPNSSKNLINKMRLIFNINKKNRTLSQMETEERQTLAIISKIVSANLTPDDIFKADLTTKTKEMIEKIIETENLPNSKHIREKKKTARLRFEKVAAEGEITQISELAEQDFLNLDTAGLLSVIKTMKEYRNQTYGL